MIVKRAREVGKPVIIATQMLESMVVNPRPTRAEVSDVATAVYEGADAVMLSAESATGAFPIRAVKTMARIVERVGESNDLAELPATFVDGGQTAAVVSAAYQLARYGQESGDIKAFVVLTESGNSAMLLARMRPNLPIIALTGSVKTMDQLQLVWGVKTLHWDYSKDETVKVPPLLAFLEEKGEVKQGDKVIFIYGETWGAQDRTNVVRVQAVI